jgi:hypothetical protein
MQNNNLEKFEQEFAEEINALKSVQFQSVQVPEFKIPTYGRFAYLTNFSLNRALSIAFAVPAFAIVFGFFFYNSGQSADNKNLSLIEESNTRILNQINTLDNESNI